MECRSSRCNREATNTEYVLCEEHAAHHEKCLEWGQLHIEGKATTEDHPDYYPIVVDAN